MEDKVFIKSWVREVQTKFGSIFNLRVDVNDLAQFASEDGWAKVTIKPRRGESDSGATHYMELDTWKPDAQQNGHGNRQGGGGYNQQQNYGQRPPAQNYGQQQGQQYQQQGGYNNAPQQAPPPPPPTAHDNDYPPF